MVIPVALAPVDELGFVPGQESQGVLRLYVTGMLLFVKHAFLLAGFGIVLHQLCVVLVAVQFDDIDVFLVGRPADVGKVTVGWVTCLQVNGFSRLYMIDADGHLMAGHACHRIFVGHEGCDAGGSVHLRIIGHHALVHPVKSQIRSFRTPECAFHDTELVAVNRLTIDNVVICFFFTRYVRAYRSREVSLVGDIQMVARRISKIAVLSTEVKVCGVCFLDAEHIVQLLLDKVVKEDIAFTFFFISHIVRKHQEVPVFPRQGSALQGVKRLDGS